MFSTFIYFPDCYQEDCVSMCSVLLKVTGCKEFPQGNFVSFGENNWFLNSTKVQLLFINPIVLVSRIQLGKKCLDTLVCKKSFKDYYLLSSVRNAQRCILIQMYVNYIVKYIAMPIQLPIIESSLLSRALLGMLNLPY